MLRRIPDGAIARVGRSITGLRGKSHIVHADQRPAADDLALLRATSGAWTGRTLTAAQEVDRLRSGGRVTVFRASDGERVVADPTSAGDPRAIQRADTGVDLSARLTALRADER